MWSNKEVKQLLKFLVDGLVKKHGNSIYKLSKSTGINMCTIKDIVSDKGRDTRIHVFITLLKSYRVSIDANFLPGFMLGKNLDTKEISSWISSEIEDKAVNIEEMSTRLGLHSSYVQSYRYGHSNPKLLTLLNMHELFGIELLEWFNECIVSGSKTEYKGEDSEFEISQDILDTNDTDVTIKDIQMELWRKSFQKFSISLINAAFTAEIPRLVATGLKRSDLDKPHIETLVRLRLSIISKIITMGMEDILSNIYKHVYELDEYKANLNLVSSKIVNEYVNLVVNSIYNSESQEESLLSTSMGEYDLDELNETKQTNLKIEDEQNEEFEAELDADEAEFIQTISDYCSDADVKQTLFKSDNGHELLLLFKTRRTALLFTGEFDLQRKASVSRYKIYTMYNIPSDYKFVYVHKCRWHNEKDKAICLDRCFAALGVQEWFTQVVKVGDYRFDNIDLNSAISFTIRYGNSNDRRDKMINNRKSLIKFIGVLGNNNEILAVIKVKRERKTFGGVLNNYTILSVVFKNRVSIEGVYKNFVDYFVNTYNTEILYCVSEIGDRFDIAVDKKYTRIKIVSELLWWNQKNNSVLYSSDINDILRDISDDINGSGAYNKMINLGYVSVKRLEMSRYELYTKQSQSKLIESAEITLAKAGD